MRDKSNPVSIRVFHDATKHRRDRRVGGRMDPANRPLPFKVYPDLELMPFEAAADHPMASALDALSGRRQLSGRIPTRADLELICHFSNGVLRWRDVPWLPDGRMAFRAAPCTGALYHIELYVACADLDKLSAGLYHFCARESGFRRLRDGDVRGILADAAAGTSAISQAPAVIVLTSTFWRNAWKYGPRAYRHTYWDGGVVTANALAVANALGLPAEVVMGFVDEEVNRLLDVDPEREVAIALIGLGGGVPVSAATEELERLNLATLPLSSFEERFDAIPAAHGATSLDSTTAVAAWRRANVASTWPGARQPDGPLRSGSPGLEAAITGRRSTRAFSHAPITQEDLQELLRTAMAPVSSDAGIGPGALYLAVSAVDGLEPGAYRVDGERVVLIRMRSEAAMRSAVTQMSLDQPLAGDAAVNVCFLADLDQELQRRGERGWRVIHMGASIAAGRLEVAAEAFGLGATGMTFFDDEVAELFELDGARTGVSYQASVGVPSVSRRTRRTPGSAQN